jgi:hypothetical protein
VSWWFIYTLHHVFSTQYIKVTICGTLPYIRQDHLLPQPPKILDNHQCNGLIESLNLLKIMIIDNNQSNQRMLKIIAVGCGSEGNNAKANCKGESISNSPAEFCTNSISMGLVSIFWSDDSVFMDASVASKYAILFPLQWYHRSARHT